MLTVAGRIKNRMSVKSSSLAVPRNESGRGISIMKRGSTKDNWRVKVEGTSSLMAASQSLKESIVTVLQQPKGTAEHPMTKLAKYPQGKRKLDR